MIVRKVGSEHEAHLATSLGNLLVKLDLADRGPSSIRVGFGADPGEMYITMPEGDREDGLPYTFNYKVTAATPIDFITTDFTVGNDDDNF